MAIEITKFEDKTVFVAGEKERRNACRWVAKQKALKAKRDDDAKYQETFKVFNNPFSCLK